MSRANFALAVKTGCPASDISTYLKFIAVLKASSNGVGFTDPARGGLAGKMIAELQARPDCRRQACADRRYAEASPSPAMESICAGPGFGRNHRSRLEGGADAQGSGMPDYTGAVLSYQRSLARPPPFAYITWPEAHAVEKHRAGKIPSQQGDKITRALPLVMLALPPAPPSRHPSRLSPGGNSPPPAPAPAPAPRAACGVALPLRPDLSSRKSLAFLRPRPCRQADRQWQQVRPSRIHRGAPHSHLRHPGPCHQSCQWADGNGEDHRPRAEDQKPDR